MTAAPAAVRAGAVRPGRAPGFTLLELIVALTITGIVVSAVALMVSAAIDAAGRTRDARRTARGERNARAVLTSLLRSTHLDLHNAPKGFQAVDAADSPTGSDELRFATRISYPLAGFREREPVGARVWVADRTVWLGLEALHPTARRGDSLALFRDVNRVHVLFRNPGAEEWQESWPYPARLPAAIRLELEGIEAPPPVEVVLPMAAP